MRYPTQEQRTWTETQPITRGCQVQTSVRLFWYTFNLSRLSATSVSQRLADLSPYRRSFAGDGRMLKSSYASACSLSLVSLSLPLCACPFRFTLCLPVSVRSSVLGSSVSCHWSCQNLVVNLVLFLNLVVSVELKVRLMKPVRREATLHSYIADTPAHAPNFLLAINPICPI